MVEAQPNALGLRSSKLCTFMVNCGMQDGVAGMTCGVKPILNYTEVQCRYRNYLMACAALMDQQAQPMYFPLLDAPVPPGIRNLQILLERAWRAGESNSLSSMARDSIPTRL